jgi:Adenine/guanine phosphoribosyltransferases and related PRPP-binding proteins
VIDLKKHVRDIPGFPKEGIIFKDITTLLQDGKAFAASVDRIVDEYKNKK